MNYVYDKLGNISKIYENGKLKARYSYDGVNRLIREDNRDFNESYFYSYDKTGNITSKRTCPFTLEETEKIVTFTSEDVFSYDGDKLIAKNNLLCAYTNGRPTTYLGKAVTFKEKGLISSYNGVSFAYDNLGKRTVKGNWSYTYNSDGDLVALTNDTTTLTYFYANTGEPLGFKKDNTSYFFRRNLQGDIIAILDSSGNVVVKYAYDAWGNHKAYCFDKDINDYVQIFDSLTGVVATGYEDNVGLINPFRYRGYYYDVETGLYYLQSRYYDPEVGRFISPDSVDYLDPDSINGLNLYAYCGNNPVMNVDPTGHSFWLVLAIAALLFTPFGGALVQATVSVVSYAVMSLWALGDLIFNGGNGAWQDMCSINWNPFNTSEQAVVDSSFISFYKGVPVFRTNMARSGSFGAIFLRRGWTDSNGVFHKLNDPNELKHERGHNWQLMMMGIANYGLMIGLPSWRKWSKRLYYNRPWEITADVLGGSPTPHTQEDINRGWWYLAISALLGPIGYFFLFGEL